MVKAINRLHNVILITLGLQTYSEKITIAAFKVIEKKDLPMFIQHDPRFQFYLNFKIFSNLISQCLDKTSSAVCVRVMKT